MARPAAPSVHSPSLQPAAIAAEALGTFWLVFAGCGSAVIASNVKTGNGAEVGVGLLGVSLAFGLAVVTGALAVGSISGAHFNPAVSIGLAVAGRFDWRRVPGYVVAQVVGASVGGLLLFVIASDRPGADAAAGGFAANGFGARSPGNYSVLAALVVEIVLTAVFVGIILAVTADAAPKTVAPFAIGLTLTVINLIAIPIDNASVNPARSLGVAWFAGGGALGQVWLFLIAPVVGGALAGWLVTVFARSPSFRSDADAEPAGSPADHRSADPAGALSDDVDAQPRVPGPHAIRAAAGRGRPVPTAAPNPSIATDLEPSAAHAGPSQPTDVLSATTSSGGDAVRTVQLPPASDDLPTTPVARTEPVGDAPATSNRSTGKPPATSRPKRRQP